MPNRISSFLFIIEIYFFWQYGSRKLIHFYFCFREVYDAIGVRLGDTLHIPDDYVKTLFNDMKLYPSEKQGNALYCIFIIKILNIYSNVFYLPNNSRVPLDDFKFTSSIVYLFFILHLRWNRYTNKQPTQTNLFTYSKYIYSLFYSDFFRA